MSHPPAIEELLRSLISDGIDQRVTYYDADGKSVTVNTVKSKARDSFNELGKVEAITALVIYGPDEAVSDLAHRLGQVAERGTRKVEAMEALK